MKLNLYSAKGTKKGTFNLPKEMEADTNLPLLAQAVHVYRENSHFGWGKTKTRGEVSISTRKIYRQKGTGGARHGAKSAPIFVGGGTAHGKKGIKRTLTIGKKMRDMALKVAISVKVKEGKAIVVDGFSAVKKTSEANQLFNKLEKAEKVAKSKRFTLVLGKANYIAKKTFRNLRNVSVLSAENLNAYKVYNGGFLVLDKTYFEKEKTATTKQSDTTKSTVKISQAKTKTQKKTAARKPKGGKK